MGISGPSARSCISTICVVVGDYQAAIYSGGSWASPVSISDSPDSISCASATSCLAVDLGGGYVIYDGSSWSSVTSFDPSTLGMYYGPTSISCPTDQFCTTVDNVGNVLTYTGSGGG